MLKAFGSEKWIVGYDFDWETAQISYCSVSGDKVETLSQVTGSGEYGIPLVLCKRMGVNQWFYGSEALQYAQENDGILVENLLQMALDGEPVQIEESEYDPIALLTLFFRRSLGLLSSMEQIEAMMITSQRMDDRMVEVLELAVANLRLKTDTVLFQSHQESYYQYMLRQSADLMKEPSVLFHYHGNYMEFLRMECNRRTHPVVALIHQEEEEFPSRASLSGMGDGDAQLDRRFLEYAQEKIGAGRTTSVWLIGDDFSEEWLKSSLKFLCEGRRIFLGNNLFSKGACYGMMERFNPSEAGRQYVFLGEEKLKSNVGMKILRRGEESYLALLDAGSNWKKAHTSWEFYLREENVVEFAITSLNGSGQRMVPVELDGLSGDVARIRMTLTMAEENLMVAEFEDLGFGEFRPAENRHWRQEIRLD